MTEPWAPSGGTDVLPTLHDDPDVPDRAALGQRPVSALAALVLLVAVVSLTAGSMLPALWGWTPHVVLSGSMAPAVHAGDVVIASPADARAALPGHVILARNPARPGQVLLHRVSSVEPDGSLRLKGDANTTTDTTPVPARDVVGVPRLRVPYVGLPVLWAQQRQWGPLLAAGLFLGGLAWTGLRPAPAYDRWDADEDWDDETDGEPPSGGPDLEPLPSTRGVDVLPGLAPARRGLGEEELRRWARDPHALSLTAEEPPTTA